MMLSSVNWSPITWRHNSAKAGHHYTPYTLSRMTDIICIEMGCHVKRFLHKMPEKVACWTILLESQAFSSTMPAIIASTMDMADRDRDWDPYRRERCHTWISMQLACADSCRFVDCKKKGKLPSSSMSSP